MDWKFLPVYILFCLVQIVEIVIDCFYLKHAEYFVWAVSVISINSVIILNRILFQHFWSDLILTIVSQILQIILLFSIVKVVNQNHIIYLGFEFLYIAILCMMQCRASNRIVEYKINDV
jgi:hypothetical protein